MTIYLIDIIQFIIVVAVLKYLTDYTKRNYCLGAARVLYAWGKGTLSRYNGENKAVQKKADWEVAS